MDRLLANSCCCATIPTQELADDRVVSVKTGYYGPRRRLVYQVFGSLILVMGMRSQRRSYELAGI